MSHAPAKCRRCQRTRSGGRMRRLTDIVPHSFQAAIHLATLPFPMERFAQGYEGFEDLRKFIKHGSEFSKDVGAILHERAELESTYAKGLNKLAAKLLKAVTVSTGSLADGWKAVGVAMEQEAELHK
ncbi:nostrin-like [Pomacea canaliculata]|nr:nostrin-like [Pomacea canaliculata]